VSLPEEGLMA